MTKPAERRLRIYGYPGTFHVQPTGSHGTVRPSEHYPWELAYVPRKDGYGAEAGVVSIHKTKREARAAFSNLKSEIFADRREDNARIKRMRQETK